MIALKYHDRFASKSGSHRWLKVKKRLKKLFHTKLRRGEMVKPYSRGYQEPD